MLCLSFPLNQGSDRDEEDSPLGLIVGLSLKGIKSLAYVRIKAIPWCWHAKHKDSPKFYEK